MPPPVIRYAITDRRLRAADERDATPLDVCTSHARAARPSGPRLPNATTPEPKAWPLDRRQTEAQPQRRDPLVPATDLPTTELTRLLRQAHHLRAQSVDYLQLREKDLAPADLRAVAIALRQALPSGSHPRLLLNLGHAVDHTATLATALAIAADGLHLPADTHAGLPAHLRTTFSRTCRSTPILSTSAHTLAEVAHARAATLDLILFGPVFGKSIDGQTVTPAVGLEFLREAVQAAGPIPVLALGGVTLANAEACLAAGARGIAGIRLFL